MKHFWSFCFSFISVVQTPFP